MLQAVACQSYLTRSRDTIVHSQCSLAETISKFLSNHKRPVLLLTPTKTALHYLRTELRHGAFPVPSIGGGKDPSSGPTSATMRTLASTSYVVAEALTSFISISKIPTSQYPSYHGVLYHFWHARYDSDPLWRLVREEYLWRVADRPGS